MATPPESLASVARQTSPIPPAREVWYGVRCSTLWNLLLERSETIWLMVSQAVRTLNGGEIRCDMIR
jgi:hypothetical protein